MQFITFLECSWSLDLELEYVSGAIYIHCLSNYTGMQLATFCKYVENRRSEDNVCENFAI